MKITEYALDKKIKKDSTIDKIIRYFAIIFGITYLLFMLYFIPSTILKASGIVVDEQECKFECELFDYSFDKHINLLNSDNKYCACLQYDNINHDKNIKYVERLN